jgi:hypothetical protein
MATRGRRNTRGSAAGKAPSRTRSRVRRPTRPSARRPGETARRRAPASAEALNDVAARLLEGALPLSRLYLTWLQQFLEPQRVLLEWYRKAIADRSLNEPADEYVRRLVKAMMAAYLDLAKSFPEQRERFSGMRSDAVKAYLDAIGDLSRKSKGTRL